MSTRIKIKVTKDVLKRSCDCLSRNSNMGSSCAIAIALKDVFGNVFVSRKTVLFFYGHILKDTPFADLPQTARDFIIEFDFNNRKERLEMPEEEFEIDIPDSVLETIGDMDEVKAILESSSTLELV